MNIVSANFINEEQTAINVVVEDMPEGMSITVPTDPANKDYVELQEWAAKEGNEIRAYVAPPPPEPQPTIQDLMKQIEELKAMMK